MVGGEREEMGLPECGRVYEGSVGISRRWRAGGGVDAAGGVVALEDGGDGVGAVVEIVLDGGAGEASLTHNAADAGIVEDGENELLELDFNGDEGRLLLLVVLLCAAAALVGLGAFEGGDEGIGEGGLGVEEGGWGGGEAVEGDVEAELEGAAVERVVGGLVVRLRLEAGAAEETGAGAQESGGDMEGSDLSVAAAAGQAEGVLQHGGSLR